MKNRTTLIIAASLLALGVASCQKEEGGNIQFTASIEQAAGQQGQKTYLDGTLIKWNGDEHVMIYGVGGTGASYSVTPRTDDATWATLSPIEGSLGSAPYKAIYPASAAVSATSIALPAIFQSDGSLTELPMYAESATNELQFKNLCGALKIHLPQMSGTAVSRIDVTADADINGTYEIDAAGEVPVLANGTNGTATTTLVCTSAQSLAEGHDFFVNLPASGTAGYSLQIAIYRADGAVCQKTCSGIVIERSKYATLSIGSLAFEFTGRLSGLFSVSATRQVRFSQGNLQWTSTGTHAVDGNGTAAGTWRFAEHQYDVVGSPSQYNGSSSSSPYNIYTGNVSGSDNAYISSSYTGWIDLFGWGTSGWNSGANAYQPYSTSTTYSDYYPGGSYTNNLTGSYANADWGVYNAISNGGNVPGQWRTLTHSEWEYLRNTRTDASSKFATGRIQLANGSYVHGCIFLPDSWTLPSGCSFTAGVSSSSDDYSRNTYTLAQWAQMEAAGALFLPAAGDRCGTSVYDVGDYGFYWSSSYGSSGNAGILYFSGSGVSTGNYIRCYGHCVRLAQDNN